MLPKHQSAIAQSRARAIIEAHLAEPFLTPIALAARFNLPRQTIYRILAQPDSRAIIDKFNTEYATIAATTAAKRAAQLLELADNRICDALNDPNCDPAFALSVRNSLKAPLNTPTTTNTQYNFLISPEDLAASRARIRAHAAKAAITPDDNDDPQVPSLPAPDDDDALEL